MNGKKEMDVPDIAEQWGSVEQIAQQLNEKAFTIRQSRSSFSGGGYTSG